MIRSAIAKLKALRDVDPSGLADGDSPVWNASAGKFEFEASGGGGGGPASAFAVLGIRQAAGEDPVLSVSSADLTLRLFSGTTVFSPTDTSAAFVAVSSGTNNEAIKVTTAGFYTVTLAITCSGDGTDSVIAMSHPESATSPNANFSVLVNTGATVRITFADHFAVNDTIKLVLTGAGGDNGTVNVENFTFGIK